MPIHIFWPIFNWVICILVLLVIFNGSQIVKRSNIIMIRIGGKSGKCPGFFICTAMSIELK